MYQCITVLEQQYSVLSFILSHSLLMSQSSTQKTQFIHEPTDTEKSGKLYIITQDIKTDIQLYSSKASVFKETFQADADWSFATKVIWELKLASPKFDNSWSFNPEDMMRYYVSNPNVSGISVLLNKKYFKGSLESIRTIKELMRSEGVHKPMFFKEFVMSKNQIDLAAWFGFDALLLIYKQLEYIAYDNKMTVQEFENYIKDLALYAQSKNIFPVIEVDNAEDLWHILSMWFDPQYVGIGINARQLDTPDLLTDKQIHFDLYTQYAEQLSPYLRFAFSGVEDLEEIKAYNNKYHGCLIGTYFSDQFAKQNVNKI